jgi:hypothetical protein
MLFRVETEAGEILLEREAPVVPREKVVETFAERFIRGKRVTEFAEIHADFFDEVSKLKGYDLIESKTVFKNRKSLSSIPWPIMDLSTEYDYIIIAAPTIKKTPTKKKTKSGPKEK